MHTSLEGAVFRRSMPINVTKLLLFSLSKDRNLLSRLDWLNSKNRCCFWHLQVVSSCTACLEIAAINPEVGANESTLRKSVVRLWNWSHLKIALYSIFSPLGFPLRSSESHYNSIGGYFYKMRSLCSSLYSGPWVLPREKND